MQHKQRISNPTAKTIRNRTYRERRKNSLIQQLGGKCAECGSSDNLTFDHINGRDWDIRVVHSEKRLRIYQEEANAGLIQLLCLSCNSRKGSPVSVGEEWDGSF